MHCQKKNLFKFKIWFVFFLFNNYLMFIVVSTLKSAMFLTHYFSNSVNLYIEGIKMDFCFLWRSLLTIGLALWIDCFRIYIESTLFVPITAILGHSVVCKGGLRAIWGERGLKMNNKPLKRQSHARPYILPCSFSRALGGLEGGGDRGVWKQVVERRNEK